MQANIVIVGATRGFETLTYSIPPALDGLVEPGHRVLAPLRSRKVTGLVTEVGEGLSTTQLKPILEVLEPQPLFDRAHLQLMEFLATYYMVSIADAYRSVIPAVARVESRTAYRIATAPDALARAAFTRVERAIIETIEKRAATTRQLETNRGAERRARHYRALRRGRRTRAARRYHGKASRDGRPNRARGRRRERRSGARFEATRSAECDRERRRRGRAGRGSQDQDRRRERGAEESRASRVDRDRCGAARSP